MLLCLAAIILVIVLIIFVVKAIETLNRVNRIADDVEGKLNTLNGFFSIIDLVTDKVSILSDTVVSAVSTAICKIFKRKGKEIDTDGEEE